MFNVENLSCVANNAKIGKVPALWLYYNEAGDDVAANGFIPTEYGIKAKDQVIVTQADGADSTWYHATVVGGKITLVANA